MVILLLSSNEGLAGCGGLIKKQLLTSIGLRIDPRTLGLDIGIRDYNDCVSTLGDYGASRAKAICDICDESPARTAAAFTALSNLKAADAAVRKGQTATTLSALQSAINAARDTTALAPAVTSSVDYKKALTTAQELLDSTRLLQIYAPNAMQEGSYSAFTFKCNNGNSVNIPVPASLVAGPINTAMSVPSGCTEGTLNVNVAGKAYTSPSIALTSGKTTLVTFSPYLGSTVPEQIRQFVTWKVG